MAATDAAHPSLTAAALTSGQAGPTPALAVMEAYAITFACVFAVNLLPAFGPPTWAILVFFKLEYDLPVVPMVLGGALCAAAGRLTLAHASRRLRGRLPLERRVNLDAAAEALTADPRRSAGALGLFALSPVPSAQLFVAAGLLDLRLLRLTGAFFAGRLVSYTLYVSGAAVAQEQFGDLLGDAFRSPVGIALQIAMLLALVALLRVDWTTRLARRGPRGRAAAGHLPKSRAHAPWSLPMRGLHPRASLRRGKEVKTMLTPEEYRRAEFGYTLAESRRGFKIHAAVYAIVMTGLIVLNSLLIANTDADFPWAVFPLVGWGIGLTFHYLYGFRRAADEARARQRKVEQYAEREKEPAL